VTFAVVALLVSVIGVLAVVAENPALTGLLTVLFGSALFLPYLWSPRAYVLSTDSVIVKRVLGDVRIVIAKEPKRWRWTWWGLRLWGSGGLYGYFGIFAFRGIGRVRMYATNRHNMVLIEDSMRRRHLLSPDDPERFIQQARMSRG
jgi:hypothetical protein